MTAIGIPRAFVFRRLHSLMGLWLVLFLMEHLLVNSQAAIWLGESGQGFVRMVNSIHNLPYLEALEVFLLGVPILLHLVLGVRSLLTSKPNFSKSDGTTPSIRQGRNRAYSWQRITSWILLIGLIGHVVKFRFLDYPNSVQLSNKTSYITIIGKDPGVHRLADRLGVRLYDAEDKKSTEWLEKYPLKGSQVIAVSQDFGTASLMSVRDTFQSPIYCILYTLFVLAACFHGFNGFWTFLITWGLILKMSAQRTWVGIATGVMILIIFLGLASIWGSY